MKVTVYGVGCPKKEFIAEALVLDSVTDYALRLRSTRWTEDGHNQRVLVELTESEAKKLLHQLVALWNR